MKKHLLTILCASFCTVSSANAEEVKVNNFPDYYQEIEPVELKDVMLQYFGSTPNGIVSYSLEDAGKASGHICPAVTGAFLMTREALKSLAQYHKNNLNTENITSYDPESGLLYRGGIKITMSGKENSGSAANAMGDVMSYITGAKGADGFKGGPNFPFANRQNLLHYDNNLQFSPKDGIEAIFTSMTATYEGKDTNGTWQAINYEDCQSTWGKCREITKCYYSVKVTYRFQSPDIIGTNPKAPWVEKIHSILSNIDKAIKVEAVDNPMILCEK